MEISFDTQELRKLCEDRYHSEKMLGVNAASVLRQRLADLRAANGVREVILGNPSFGLCKGQNRFRLELDRFGLLSFEPNHIKNLAQQGEDIEWEMVSRLKLVNAVFTDA